MNISYKLKLHLGKGTWTYDLDASKSSSCIFKMRDATWEYELLTKIFSSENSRRTDGISVERLESDTLCKLTIDQAKNRDHQVRSSYSMHMTIVTRLGNFRKLLAPFFLQKRPKLNIWWILGYFEKHQFSSKNLYGYFFAALWGKLFFSNTVWSHWITNK